MSCNEQSALSYQERIMHLLRNYFAEEIIDTIKTNKTLYLPHFDVDNPNKSKLCLVLKRPQRRRAYHSTIIY